MEPLRFKFDNSLNLRKTVKVRASIITSLKFVMILLLLNFHKNFIKRPYHCNCLN